MFKKIYNIYILNYIFNCKPRIEINFKIKIKIVKAKENA